MKKAMLVACVITMSWSLHARLEDYRAMPVVSQKIESVPYLGKAVSHFLLLTLALGTYDTLIDSVVHCQQDEKKAPLMRKMLFAAYAALGLAYNGELLWKIYGPATSSKRDGYESV